MKGIKRATPSHLVDHNYFTQSNFLAFSKREGAQSAVYMLSWHMPDEADALKVIDSLGELMRVMTAG